MTQVVAFTVSVLGKAVVEALIPQAVMDAPLVFNVISNFKIRRPSKLCQEKQVLEENF